MKNRMLIRASILATAGAAVLTLGGCYTVLLTTGGIGTASSGDEETYSSAGGPDIQYSSDCRSCHSDAELADRAYDVRMADLQVVHGVAIDPYGWDYHYRPQPWWVPAVVPAGSAAASTPSVTTGTAFRTRSDGDSRGRTVDAVVPTPNQSSTPPAPPAATPASGAKSTGAEAPAPRPRTETKSGGSRARTDGSTRGDRK